MTLKMLILGPLFLGAAACAIGQWDEVVELSQWDGNITYLYPQLLVDSLFRLHTFYVREDHSTSPQTSSLVYERFSNWGDPIGAPLDLLRDTHWIDYRAGVLLDRNGAIHVIWGRRPNHLDVAAYYARLDLEGEFLTPPTQIIFPNPELALADYPRLAQHPNGTIWIANGQYYFAVSEEGALIREPQEFWPTPQEFTPKALAISPTGEVWACGRGVDTVQWHQAVVTIRIDSTVHAVEYPWTGGAFEQVIPEGFFIDSCGAFHFIMYTDHVGLFYLRDARDSTAVDTAVIATHLFGQGSTGISLVGQDTLIYLWGETAPRSGYWRVGFDLSGEMVLPQTFAEVWFEPESSPIVWKMGSYWIPGDYYGVDFGGQLGMIHVPGPDEPPDTLAAGLWTPDRSRLRIALFPQPAKDHVTISLPSPTLIRDVMLYNLLGRRIAVQVSSRGPSSQVEILLPHGLTTGTYFLSVRADAEIHTRSFHLIH